MLQSFNRVDANKKPTMIRGGNALGGKIPLDISEMAVNTWYRVMPSAANATVLDNNQMGREVEITLRSDVLTPLDWNFIVLQQGYYQERVISNYNPDTNVISFDEPLQHYKVLNRDYAGTLQYIIYPNIINPIGMLVAGGGREIDYGVTLSEAYTVENSDMHELMTVEPRIPYLVNFSRLDKLFYRFAQLPNADTTIMWGESFVWEKN